MIVAFKQSAAASGHSQANGAGLCSGLSLTRVLLILQALTAKSELLVPANPPVLDGVNDLTGPAVVSGQLLAWALHA